MSLSKTEVINFLMVLCEKYDNETSKGTKFYLLEKYFDLEGLVVLILCEKLEPRSYYSSHVLKHQRVKGIRYFLKDIDGSSIIFEALKPLIAEIADFINGY